MQKLPVTQCYMVLSQLGSVSVAKQSRRTVLTTSTSTLLHGAMDYMTSDTEFVPSTGLSPLAGN